MCKKTSVAIIVPVVNEKNLIADTLNHLLSLGADEVIAVDGGSKDGTCEIIMRDFPSVRCFETAYADRALQMNLGAFEAKSDIFLFVHADMRLPQNAVESIKDKIHIGFVGGGFKKRYSPANWIMNLYAFLQNAFYFGMMKCLVGSNAIFAARSAFDAEHGFPDVAFLEDLMFSECLSRRGQIAIIDQPVAVSSRRYFETGVIRQIVKNIRIMIGYKFFHEDLESLRERYKVISHGV